MIAALAGAGAAMWLAVLLLPWRPWSTREHLDADPGATLPSTVTVVIPARDEAATIADAVRGAAAQGPDLRVLVVDDGSGDDTAALARAAGAEVIAGTPLPDGWSGKLWALEQGRRAAATPLLLLLDADIRLTPGTAATLLARMRAEGSRMGSLMAALSMAGGWERLLLPAFVWFFKLLYPFRLANGPGRAIAAAAGGCILVEARCLDAVGGFAALRGALIDDCTLARRVKQAGFRTWIGLTRDAVSLRPYPRLADIWAMVARTAYPQLRRSPALLLLCTLAMAAAFWGPPLGLLLGAGWGERAAGAAGWAAMAAAYLPTLRYYRRAPAWSILLPAIGTLYMAMTLSSALDHWRGRGSRWKGRDYRLGGG